MFEGSEFGPLQISMQDVSHQGKLAKSCGSKKCRKNGPEFGVGDDMEVCPFRWICSSFARHVFACSNPGKFMVVSFYQCYAYCISKLIQGYAFIWWFNNYACLPRGQ